MLIKSAGDPNLPAEFRTMANTMLTRALESTAPTSDMREYAFHVQQARAAGREPEEFTDWQRANKKSGASNIDVSTRMETEEGKALGKGAGEASVEMYKSARAAGTGLQNITRIESLLRNVDQGKLQPGRMSISAWAKSFGLNDDVAKSIGLDPAGIGNAQALNALINESVVSKIGSGGFPANNFSNTDREFLVDTLPKLGNDPRANHILTETARRAYQLDIDKSKAFNAFKKDPENRGKNYFDFETDWADKLSQQDRFGDLRRQAETIIGNANANPNDRQSQQPAPAQSTAPVRVNSPENARKLPPGTPFVTPDGREFTR